jgi:toxin-antitoxin system PIN domain toxin
LILTDVNVLVKAHRRDAEQHKEFLAWLERALSLNSPFGYSEMVFSGFIRIVTNPRIFAKPSSLQEAFGFVDIIRSQPNAIRIAPQVAHWKIFSGLCTAAEAKANLVADAYLAALAIESGSEWITADRDFARFPGLKWRHPLGP